MKIKRILTAAAAAALVITSVFAGGNFKEVQAKDNDTQKKIIKMLSKNNRLSARQMSEQIGISSRNIENNIRTLKKHGMLIRHGSPKNGYWEIP